MTIDTRATTAISINGKSYKLISATLSDEHIQGNGIIRCRGNCVIDGMYSLTVGSVVILTYKTATGITRTIPRRIQVLSSFANVHTRTTQVELGDSLVVAADRKPAPDEKFWTPKDENETVRCKLFKLVALPVKASTIVTEALSKAGIPGGGVGLNSHFTPNEDGGYDLSGGYIAAVDKLMAAEGKCGYMASNGIFGSIDVWFPVYGGPLIQASDLISVGPIGTGTLPGATVTSNYTFKRLSKDPLGKRNKSLSEDKSGNFVKERTIGDLVSFTETVGSTDATVSYSYQERTEVETKFDKWNRAESRLEVVNGYPLQKWTQTYWTYEVPVDPDTDDELAINCKKAKPANWDVIVSEETTVTDSIAAIVKACNFDPDFYPSLKSLPTTRVTVERTVVEYTKDISSGATLTTTRRYVPFVMTPQGAEIIRKQAALVDAAPGTVGGSLWTTDLVLRNAQALTQYGSTVKIRSEKQFGLQRKPITGIDNPDLGYVDGSAQINMAFGGGSTKQSLDIPESPDDYYTGGFDDPIWNPSLAFINAISYATAQNALLIGNRLGMSIQCSPLKLPDYPFAPFCIKANGFVVQYKANGLQWDISTTDVILSCDALYVGVIGADAGVDPALSWGPLPPDTTTLPIPPDPVPDDTYGETITPIAVIPPYKLTIQCQGAISLYAASPIISAPIIVFIDSGDYVLTGSVEGGTDRTVDITSSAYTFTGYDIAAGLSVAIDAGSYSLTGYNATTPQGLGATIETGNYSITGNAIIGGGSFIDTATYALTGNAIYGGGSFIDTSSYSMVGNSMGALVNLISGGNFIDTGSNAMTGYDIDAMVHVFVNIDAGSNAMTGYGIGATVDTGGGGAG